MENGNRNPGFSTPPYMQNTAQNNGQNSININKETSNEQPNAGVNNQPNPNQNTGFGWGQPPQGNQNNAPSWGQQPQGSVWGQPQNNAWGQPNQQQTPQQPPQTQGDWGQPNQNPSDFNSMPYGGQVQSNNKPMVDKSKLPEYSYRNDGNLLYGVLSYMGVLALIPLYLGKLETPYMRRHANYGLTLTAIQLLLAGGSLALSLFLSIIPVLGGFLSGIIATLTSVASVIICIEQIHGLVMLFKQQESRPLIPIFKPYDFLK